MKIPFLKKKIITPKNTKYNIDYVLPSKIIGWITSKDIDFEEIRLISDSITISKSKIDIERVDVFKKFGFNLNVGFILNLPTDKPSLNSKKIEISAYSKDKKYKFNLKIYQKQNIKKTSSRLLNILSSDILGLDGHFDGKANGGGSLKGWVSSFSKNAPTIWLNLTNKDSIPVRCSENYFKKEKSNKYFYDYYTEIEDIPINYSGEVWFSFDKEGIYKIPQDNLVDIETIDIDSNVINLGSKKKQTDQTNLYKKRDHSSPEIKEYWDYIISNEEFLNNIEQIIDNKKRLSIGKKFKIFKSLLLKPFM